MGLKEEAIRLMQEEFGEHKKWITHSLRVLGYAEKILKLERVKHPFIKDVVILSAIFHDLGIPIAEKKYGNRNNKNQEKEGRAIAERLLEMLGVRRDIKERVSYIVGHHHTVSAIDGPDFEILWDADLLTNIYEGRIDMSSYPEEKGFKTESGKKLYENS